MERAVATPGRSSWRRSPGPSTRPGEWLVRVRTPEASIRIDLLLIGPVLAVPSGWALFRALR